MTNEPLFVHLEAELVEDLHTGAGTGSGDIDALVLRDRYDNPVIRSSHFKGLLRKAGNELVNLKQIAQDDLDELLGHDITGRNSSSSGKLRKSILRMTSLRVSDKEKVPTLVWGSSAREVNSRRPQDDTLRYIEHVAAGTKFKTCFRLPPESSHLRLLLERLLKRIDRVGGGRRRGSGLVQLSWKPHQVTTPKNDMANKGTHLRMILRNREPLCFPATGHPGNLMRTSSFIRGQALRGALMAWAFNRDKTKALDVSSVSVGDALPLPDSQYEKGGAFPIPLSVLKEKPKGDASSSLPWWAGGSVSPEMFDSICKQADSNTEKPKRPGKHEYLFRSNSNNQWLRYSPQMNRLSPNLLLVST